MDLDDFDPLLTIAEVALKLRVSRRTVLRLLDQGALAGTRVGQQRRVFTSSLGVFQPSPVALRPGAHRSDRKVAA
jgi:excisionase family DNA binding protein